MLIVAVLSLAGFRGSLSRKPPLEVFPDMDRQQKLRPQEPNHFFTNGFASRKPVEGTIARLEPLVLDGQAIYDFEDHPVNTGFLVGTTNWIELNPIPITEKLVNRGHERYSINCAPCHGAQGDGKGIVSKYGWLSVANLHDPRIVAQPDGEIFYTITHGKNTMGSYANKIDVEDRWAIVAYVRALQLSQLGGIEDVPQTERANLN